MEDNNTMLTRPSSLQTTQTTRLFKKNPKLKPKSASTAVAVAAPTQRLSPTTAGSAIAGVDYPGLAFIDDEQHHEQRLSFCLGQAEACGENDEKASNDNNIETEPTTKAASIADSKPRIPRKDELFSFHKKAFKRDLNSPTKSLQLESASKVQVDNRRSSLSLLALSAAAQVTSPVLQPQSAYSSTSLASMISLPGVPPVPGVSESPLQRQLTRKAPHGHGLNLSSSRLQSEEDLIIDYQRKKEMSVMRPTKLKEESSILKNIKKREMMDKLHKSNTSQLERREKEEKKRLQDHFGIASGILKSRNLFLAPVGSIIEEDLSSPDPTSDNPLHRRIVRRVAAAKVHLSPELTVQAETRFSESLFVSECLEWHNHYRKRHLAPDLQFDAILCATAQHWANMLAHRDEFCYQNPVEFGENLFAWLPPVAQLPTNQALTKKKKKPDVSGKDVSVYWYKSQRDYDYTKDPKVLHAHAAPFTQMVWHSTQKFGCGKAKSRSGKVIVVAYYEPKGNIPGQFHDNVLPPAHEDGSSEDDSSDEGSENQKRKPFLAAIFGQRRRRRSVKPKTK